MEIPIYNLIKNTYLHIKYSRILKKAMKEDNVIEGLEKLFGGVKFKKDWIGRIYVVLNPVIVNGKYDPTALIQDAVTGSSEEFMKDWLMQRLIATQTFIKANNLFELLTYDFKQIDNYGNWLFIMYPITLTPFLKSIKINLIFLFIIGLILTGILIFLP